MTFGDMGGSFEEDPMREDLLAIRAKRPEDHSPTEAALLEINEKYEQAYEQMEVLSNELAPLDDLPEPQVIAQWVETFKSATRERERAFVALRDQRAARIEKERKNTFLPAPRSPKPKPLPPDLLFGSNNVTGAAVRALAGARDWPAKPIEGFAYGMTQDFKNLKITIGLPDGTQADSLWAFLSRDGAPMVKAHYALWGRWYEEGADPSGGELTVNVNQFCADLGYTPHHKGGYRTELKHQAVRQLEALTAVEMRATFTKPGNKPGTEKAVRLRGPLWRRGLIAEENDRYTDLFGQAREGEPNLWEPLAFSYAPGPWFTVAEWRKYNKAVGKIGSGLMKLDNRYDEWAVLIGGYLGTQMRTEQYRPCRRRVGTILAATNLAQTPDARRRAAQYQEKFERALDRLTEVGVIASWTWPDVDAAELCDPDDPDAVAAYYANENPFPKGDWRARIVLITFPYEADAARLQKAETKAIAAARLRQRRRGSKAAEPGRTE